jgi:hypothetical protein
MQGKTVVLDIVILIAASNFHVLCTVIGCAKIIKENSSLSKKALYVEGLAWCRVVHNPHWMMTFAIIIVMELSWKIVTLLSWIMSSGISTQRDFLLSRSLWTPGH